MQIIPGVYLVNGSPYGRYQNGYLIHNGAATVLVDSGDLRDDVTLPDVVAQRRPLGFRDRAGLAPVYHPRPPRPCQPRRRSAAPGLKLVATPATAEAMAAGDTRCIGFTAHRKFEPCQIDVELRDGEELDVNGLRVRLPGCAGPLPGIGRLEVMLGGERLWFTRDCSRPSPPTPA
jgi:glyoxylase-like metal-dependent hydrolase (beta-lactamase superfamily II)